jgi:O-antigen ligase
LSLLKFGNPPIMEKYVSPPADAYEFLLGYPWPIAWAYRLLALVTLAALFSLQWKRQRRVPQWILALPVFWLAWQFLSGIQTVDPRLSIPTVKHFVACVVCFYFGYFCLGERGRAWSFWLGLALGFVVVLGVGFEQHFGGLEQSKRYFFLYVYPQLTEPPPPEYIKKLSSSRIFSTLFYPNALAGVLLLLLPPIAVMVLQLRRMTWPARVFLAVLLALAALLCLFWSGSKGGWLLMLLLGLVALLRIPFKAEYKIVLVTCVFIAGLTGFFWKYSGFFQRGATSVSARFDYWRAAIQTAKSKPLFGTGPGTFAIPYQKIKRPESEMARLTHNDYLQQASDSGLVGFLTYSGFVAGALAWAYRRLPRFSRITAEPQDLQDWFTFAVWLGLLGWALQGLFEFGLYIPGLSWPALVLLGWLLASHGHNSS